MAGNAEAALRIETGVVDVRLTAMADVGAALKERYAALLDTDEQARWRRFRVDGARDQYLIGRALLRTTLSRHADVAPTAWRFETNAYGCPFVAAPVACRDLRFNLSHTDGLVACAVTRRGEVGIDVENTDREVDPLALAPTVFAPAEIADLAAMPAAGQRERFFSYWTLKESYIKARGMGLSLPLDGFWFDLGSGAPRIRFAATCPDRPGRWHFEQHQPTPHHKLALAVSTAARATPAIRQCWVVPLAAAASAAVSMK
jgi:4'-phosphopantetheinyl transferase